MLIDVPGATPSQLSARLGKDGNAYLVNRNNLGGITGPVAQQCWWSLVVNRRLLTARRREHILFFAPMEQSSQGLQDYCDKSADHSQRLDREPDRPGLAVGYNY